MARPANLARLLLLAAATAAPALAAVPAGFSDTLVFNLGSPTALAFTPDGRMLVTTQTGALRVYQGGALLATPALTFLDESICTNSERGLLGVAVHPAFAANRYIYLFYTRELPGTGDETPCVNRVSRFTLPDTNMVDSASELVLIDNMPSPNGNHNAGDVQFGKDGYLYVTIGDGGPGGNARLRHQLSGKVLRITDDGGIPATNPFQGALSARCNVIGSTTVGNDCRETFAWGLRNPFRMAFDPNAAGTRFFINDTGQNAWEETDEGAAGVDYGWNCREGARTTGSCASLPSMVDPIFEYAHGAIIPGTTSPTNCNAITGGAFVPNGLWPGYDGTYIFGDVVCGWMPRLAWNGSAWVATDFGTSLGSLVHLRFGPWGNSQALYYTSYAGQVRRISRDNPSGNDPPTAVAGGSPLSGPAPLIVTFDAAGSSDPDPGDTLTYFWDFGDGSAPLSTTSLTIQHTYAQGTFTATLRARDNNFAFSPPVTLQVQSGNQPPVPTIEVPAASATFGVGETITLHGSATDPQDGTLGPSALSWEVRRWHNGNHWHPYVSPTAGNDVPFQAPPPEDGAGTEAGNYLEIRLTATDSGGLTTTVTRDFQPARVALSFTTQPAGLDLRINGALVSQATAMTSWRHWGVGLEAADQTTTGGTRHLFLGWSPQGGGGVQTLVTPAVPTDYVAVFQEATVTGPLDFYTLTPCRLVDTRLPDGPLGGPALAGGQQRDFNPIGACGLPATAIALAINVTVVQASAGGFLQLFASDELGTPTSTMNFQTGATRANNASVRLSASGSLTALAALPPAATVHLVIDVVGYYQ